MYIRDADKDKDVHGTIKYAVERSERREVRDTGLRQRYLQKKDLIGKKVRNSGLRQNYQHSTVERYNREEC